MATISSLSRGQYTALWAVGLTSSSLSIMGSCCIISIAARKYNQKFFHRLMLGLSIGDIIFSVTCFLQAFLQPNLYDFAMEVTGSSLTLNETQSTSINNLDSFRAFGNTSTCAALGFFMRFPLTIAIYNCYLSIYFNYSTRQGWDERSWSGVLEFATHSFAFGLPIIFGTVGVLTDAFNPLPLVHICDTGPWPPGCIDSTNDTECVRGKTSLIQDWCYLGIMLLVSVVGLWNTASVYIFVKRQTKESRKHSFEVQNSISVSLQPPGDNRSHHLERSTSVQFSNDSLSPIGTMRKTHSRVLSKVAQQSVMYTVAYLNGLFWAVTSRIILDVADVHGRDNEPQYYVFVLLAFLFYPLLGFWNAFIYIQPRYSSWRRLYPNKSVYWVTKRVLQGKEPYEQFRRRSGARMTLTRRRSNNNIRESNSGDSFSLSQFFVRSLNTGQENQNNADEDSTNFAVLGMRNDVLLPTPESDSSRPSEMVHCCDISPSRAMQFSSSTPESVDIDQSQSVGCGEEDVHKCETSGCSIESGPVFDDIASMSHPLQTERDSCSAGKSTESVVKVDEEFSTANGGGGCASNSSGIVYEA